jgi:hypothetical protein
MARRSTDPDGGIIVKALAALWIGVLAFGFVAQSTELLGSINGTLVWLLAGGGAALLLVALASSG